MGGTPLDRARADADRYGGHVVGECMLSGGRIDLDACPPGCQLIVAGAKLPAGGLVRVEPCYGQDEGKPERHAIDARLEAGALIDASTAPPHARLVASRAVYLPAGAGIVLRALSAAPAAAEPKPARRPRAREE